VSPPTLANTAAEEEDEAEARKTLRLITATITIVVIEEKIDDNVNEASVSMPSLKSNNPLEDF